MKKVGKNKGLKVGMFFLFDGFWVCVESIYPDGMVGVSDSDGDTFEVDAKEIGDLYW
jgi:hypothetical protein